MPETKPLLFKPLTKFREFLPVLLLFAVSVMTTFLVWSFETRHISKSAELNLQRSIAAIRDDTIATMRVNAQAVRGGAAFYKGSSDVSRNDWADYVSDLGFGEGSISIQGIGYNPIVRGPVGLRRFLDDARETYGPTYDVTPHGIRDIYAPVLYVEPFTDMNRGILGFDIYSEPVRRAAIDYAIATGEASMTAKITLNQDAVTVNEEFLQAGVLLMLPVFEKVHPQPTVTKNQGEIEDLVVGVFRMDNLMSRVVEHHEFTSSGAINIELFDSTQLTEKTRLFGQPRTSKVTLELIETFPIYGQEWTMRATVVADMERLNPTVIAVVGGVLTFILTAFIWTLTLRARDSRRAAEVAQENNIHVQALMHEMNHRSKNLLAVVQAIVRLSGRSDPDQFLEHFSGRIDALAASQDLLVRSAWHGTQMSDLVQSQLSHFQNLVGTRIFVHGGAVQLQSAAAQTIGMALHELGTNAGKYGALSNETGRVTICWFVDTTTHADARLVISWIETDGPPMPPPTEEGFGTMVTGKMVRQGLKADVRTDNRETGLEWHFSCKADAALEPIRSPIR